MKHLVFTVFLMTMPMFASVDSTSAAPATYSSKSKVDFLETYRVLRSYEGAYSNHPLDRGGETYGGIARNMFPEWRGWWYVDWAKGDGKLKWNTKVVMAEWWNLDFFLTLWLEEGWDTLTNQELANYLFEFRVHATVGTEIIQEAILDCGGKVSVNNIMDHSVIAAINALPDDEQLLTAVRCRRISFYRNIVTRDRSQRLFLHHWLYRADGCCKKSTS